MRGRGLNLLLAGMLVLAVLGQAPTALAAAGARTALVIGNGAYRDAPLKNPVNDARDMAQALKNLGFGVTLLTDASHQQMDAAVRDFGKTLRQGGVGLFYFAGHGVQVGGENYLVPVDASIASEADVKFGCLNAGLVLGKMEDAANGLNVIILDACRNNPFARSFRSAEIGLAKMDAPTGSIIAYATAPGSVAADGAGRNGVYTEQLLKNLRTPGLPITDLFMRVRMGVVAATGKKQVPWEASSLTGYFYFGGEAQPGQAQPPMPSLPPAPAPQPVPSALPKLDPKAEKRRLADEAARLKRDQEELAQYQAIQAEKDRLDLERQKLEQAKLLTMAKRPQQASASASPAAASAPSAHHANQFAQLARIGLPDARAYFEQAVQAHPDDADARAGLAIALVFAGREADAKYQLQRLNETGVQTPGVRLAKGLLLGLEGSSDAAYQFSRAQEDGADRALVALCQGAAMLRSNDFEAALGFVGEYEALVIKVERNEFAKQLAEKSDPKRRLAGRYDLRWGGNTVKIEFMYNGGVLTAKSESESLTEFPGTYINEIAIDKGKLRFRLNFKVGIFGMGGYEYWEVSNCDVTGSLAQMQCGCKRGKDFLGYNCKSLQLVRTQEHFSTHMHP